MAYIILNGNFLCLSCPSATFASQHAGFVPREWQAAKGLLEITLKSKIKESKNGTATQNIFICQVIVMCAK